MTRRWPLVTKELRALLPLWASSLVAMSLHLLRHNGELEAIAMLGYVFGAVVVGAHAIGHEYSYRTLGTLLTQPVDRRRVLLTKLTVTGALLVLLFAAAWPLMFVRMTPRPDMAVLLLPLAGGLFVAPWLTMVARNQLAGAVFTVGIAGLVFVAGEFASGDRFGGTAAAEAARLAIVARVLLVFAVVAAVLGWRKFMRLEAIEGDATDFHLPRLRAAEDGRDTSAVSLLIRKELRLQQMSFVLAGAYVIIWGLLLIRGYGATGDDAQKFAMVFGPVTLIYFWGLSLLIGSLASAEERQFGVHESQLLLPISTRVQWLIKAGVAIAVAVLLAVVIPTALIQIASRLSLVLSRELPPLHMIVLIVTAVTSCGLFVSSVSTSGIRAIMMGFPFIVAATWLVTYVEWAIMRSSVSFFTRSAYQIGVERLADIITAVVFIALLLWFGGENHRSSERSVRRIAWQIGAVAVLITAGPLLIARVLLAI